MQESNFLGSSVEAHDNHMMYLTNKVGKIFENFPTHAFFTVLDIYLRRILKN